MYNLILLDVTNACIRHRSPMCRAKFCVRGNIHSGIQLQLVPPSRDQQFKYLTTAADVATSCMTTHVTRGRVIGAVMLGVLMTVACDLVTVRISLLSQNQMFTSLISLAYLTVGRLRNYA